MDRLSKDQKGKMAPSVSRSWRSSSESTGRTQIAYLPSGPLAVKAMVEPSGEMIGGPALSPARLMCNFSGGLMTVRTEEEGAERWEKYPASAPSNNPAMTAAIQVTGRRAGMDETATGEL